MTGTEPQLGPWQNPEDGMPTDAYFDAVVAEIEAVAVELDDWWRDEPWEFTAKVKRSTARACGAPHGLFISWRTDELDEPKHADDFTGMGWYWVPYTKRQALGDFAKEFGIAYLADPSEVATAVAEMIAEQRRYDEDDRDEDDDE